MTLILASIIQAQAAPSVFSSDVQMCSGRPWIDVTCNGADPTGAADSTAAINNTISTAVTNDWPIFFPAGTYKVTSKITVEFGGQANNGPQIISREAIIDGRSIASGNVMQVQCTGGTTASPVVCNHFSISGWLTVMGSGAGYVFTIGKTDFSDQQNGVRIEHLVVTNAGSGGAIQANYLTNGDVWLSGGTAGGSSSVGAVSLEQTQSSKIGGYGSALGASAPGLLVENGNSVNNNFVGFAYDPNDNTCVSVTSATATRNAWLAPYFPCTTAVSTTSSAGQNALIGPTFAGTNEGPTSTGVTIIGRGSLSRYSAPAVSSQTLVGADDGTIFSAANATGTSTQFTAASLPLTLPSAAQVGAGWTVGVVSDQSKAVVLTAPAGSKIIARDQQLSSLTVAATVGNGNYETAVLQSDGSNFRVLYISQRAAMLNQLQMGLPANWIFLPGPSYQITNEDNGNVLSSGTVSSTLTLTLPQTTTLINGWTVSFVQDAGKKVIVQTNATNGGNIIQTLGSTKSYATTYNGQIVTLQFDGASFRILSASPSGFLNVQMYGARCDGSTDDSAAFTAGLNSLSSTGGGVLYVPATGHSCVLHTGQNLPAGVSLEGISGYNQPANVFDNTEADWETSGSWIRCDDTVNPCLKIAAPGSHIKGLNVWYTQPTPIAGACAAQCTLTHNWTPTTYPFTILVGTPAQNGGYLEDLNIINGYSCVDIEGNPNESLGINSYGFHEDHVRLGCFNVVQRMAYVDNTISIHDWRDQTWWYIGSTDLLGYMEGDGGSGGHRIGMDMQYVANAQATDVEFYEDWTGIRAGNGTVTSGLGTIVFAAQALQFTNISFNQTCQGIVLNGGTTYFNGRFVNVIAAGDVQTAYGPGQCSRQWPVFFNLSSDNADVAITNLDGYVLQQIAAIGNGNSGVLHLYGNIRASYSAYAPGAHAFVIANNAALDMPADFNALFPGVGASTAISGNVNWPVVSASPTTWLNGPTGTTKQITYLSGLAARWGVASDNTAETGSNNGSNFVLFRYADNGTFLDIPLSVNRQSGAVFLNDGYYLPGIAISNLPACSASTVGFHFTVSNGISSPTYGATVGSTGSTIDPVFCNGTNWVYQ